jgi:hypothetical protein
MTQSAALNGAIGDGVTDDTTSIQRVFTDCAKHNDLGLLIGSKGNRFKISSPINISGACTHVAGLGQGLSTLVASGNFGSVLSIAPSAQRVNLNEFTIDQTGTTTQCVNIAERTSGRIPLNFEHVEFIGDMAGTNGSLVYCAGVLVQFFRCEWSPNNAKLVCLQFDMNNENSSVSGCSFIGAGCGISLTKTGSGIGPQGIRISDTVLASFGAAYNIHVGGNAANVYISNTACDQAATNAILIDQGCAAVSVRGGWAGLEAASTGQAILIDPTAQQIMIDGVQIYGGNFNILVEASASQQLNGLQIQNNMFFGAKVATMQLDSANATITGNRDYNAPSIYCLITLGTNPAKGTYTIIGNTSNKGPITLDPASTYIRV